MDQDLQKWATGLLISLIGAIGGAALSSLFGHGFLLVVSRFDFIFGISVGIVVGLAFIFGASKHVPGIQFGPLRVRWRNGSREQSKNEVLSVPDISISGFKQWSLVILRWGSLFLTVLITVLLPFAGGIPITSDASLLLLVLDYLIDSGLLWPILVLGQIAWVIRADELQQRIEE